jgi:pyridoxal 5'-phosphate synthase pdxT subunit
MRLGVLALQGDVPEHRDALRRYVPRARVDAVRTPSELDAVDALFLPGGESTTIARLLVEGHLWAPLQARLHSGLPVLATCAGLILLAQRLAPGATGTDPPTLDLLDVTVRRNDYGAQRESCEAAVRVEGLGARTFNGVFIRSPRILEVGAGATPIAWRGREVVGIRAGKMWGLTFHPELAGDPRVHRRFLASVGLRA